MIRRLAALGSALLVSIVFCGLFAAPSHAASPQTLCTLATTPNCFITGSSNDHVITVDGGDVRCTESGGVKGAKFTTTAWETTVTISLGATYTNCRAFGVRATISMEGCFYQVQPVEEGASPFFPTTTSIVCPGVGSPTVSTPSLPCTITIGPQTGIESLTLANTGSEPTSLAASLNLTGIFYGKTGSGCPGSTGSFSNGKYTGTMTLSGYEDRSGREGAKVGLHILTKPPESQTPEAHCTASTANCFITGASNDNVFSVEGSNITCTESGGVRGARFSATASKTTATIELTATYSNCRAFGARATISMEGCVYRVQLVEGGASPFSTTTAVACPAGKSIAISVPGLPCTITIGPQSGLETFTLENTGSEPTGLAATLRLKAITYTVSGEGCPRPGTFNTGTYNGTVTLSGYEDNAGAEGTKVGLHVF